MRIPDTSVSSQVHLELGPHGINAKFFYAEPKYTLAELARMRQYPGDDLDLYFKRFRGKELDCSDPVDEQVLVNVYLHSMDNEYRVFVEYLSSPPFPSWWKH